jgi:hypothetical protein
MKFRIDGAVVAVCAVSLLCAFGVSARADGGAGEGKGRAVAGSQRAPAKGQLHKYTAALPAPPQSGFPKYREVFWQPFGWGGPPRQDPRDAYQGYFANPLDDPRYYGSGRTTLTFR